MKTLIRYFGSKSDLLNDIFSTIKPLYKNKNIITFVDVFGGSGKVLLNIPDDWKVNKIYNDIDHRIFTLLNILKNDEKRKILFERLEYTAQSRELFNQIKNENPTNDIDIAFNYLYLNFFSYNGNMNSYKIRVKTYRDDLNTQIKNLFENFKYIQDWNIENLDFRDLIPKYDSEKTFFYLDPPYLKSGKIYDYSFDIQDYINLKRLLNNIKGYWLMNESEVDFKNIKEIFGEPNFVKEYNNHFNHKNQPKNTKRLEGFWANFDVL
jgi:DNA adenine methylase